MRLPDRRVRHHHAQALHFLLQRSLPDQPLQRFVADTVAQAGWRVLPGRQLGGRLGQRPLVFRLEKRAFDGLAVHLRHPGRAADHAYHVADAPNDEGDHHDQEQASDNPGFEVAAEGGDHRSDIRWWAGFGT